MPISPDFKLEYFGKRIHDRNPNPMQATGNLVCFAVEFATRVQHGHDHFGRGNLFRRMHPCGYASTVVFDGDRRIQVDRDGNIVAVSGQRFVDRIVHHFPYELMETFGRGIADVHTGRIPNCLKAFQNFYIFSAVILIFLHFVRFPFLRQFVFKKPIERLDCSLIG